MSAIDQMLDRPGTRGRRRIRLGSLVAGVVLLGVVVLVLVLFGRSGGLAHDKWAVFTHREVLRLLGSGLLETLKVSATSGVFALALGLVLAVGRMSRSGAVSRTVGAYVEATRSLPTLLVLYFSVLTLPSFGVQISAYWQVVIALTITNASMICEIVRSCILAVPRGQTDASLALGFTQGRSLRLVVLPQAFRASTPALVAQLVYLLKSSTLGYVVSYQELLYNGRILGSFTGNLLQAFLVIAVIYFVICSLLSQAAVRLEARVASHDGRRPTPVTSLVE